MKSRIKTRHLRDIGKGLGKRSYARQIVWLMQQAQFLGEQRAELAERSRKGIALRS